MRFRRANDVCSLGSLRCCVLKRRYVGIILGFRWVDNTGLNLGMAWSAGERERVGVRVRTSMRVRLRVRVGGIPR